MSPDWFNYDKNERNDVKILEQYRDNAPSRWAVYPPGKTWFMANGRLYAMAALATFDTEEEAKAFVASVEGKASK